MCWVTYKTPIKQIAKEDIPVLKTGLLNRYTFAFANIFISISRFTKKCAYSEIYKFKYERRKTYHQDKPIEIEVQDRYSFREYVISKGFHSYDIKQDSNITLFGRKDGTLVKLPSGVKLISNHFPYLDLVKIYCHIPKGTVFYINEHDEIVSEAITIDKIEMI